MASSEVRVVYLHICFCGGINAGPEETKGPLRVSGAALDLWDIFLKASEVVIVTVKLLVALI